jgi:isoleucyl-tRNA synthetase
MDVVEQIRWIPEFGFAREMDWLRNMHDWMISKKRYWGLALPIWVCDQL